MTLIISISGIRGIIGGKPGDGLNPVDVVKFTAAYAEWTIRRQKRNKPVVITGRDARVSGDMLSRLVTATLNGMGVDVIDLGLVSTPTVEIAVERENAQGGIILTASHNPGQWNALKLLNEKGEFLSAEDGRSILQIVKNPEYEFAVSGKLGSVSVLPDYGNIHVDMIMDLDLIDREAIRKAELTVAIDCVNSVGGLILPELLKKLGVSKIIELYTEPSGIFPHNPEPLPENLADLAAAVIKNKASLGFIVDPDVDRLAIVSEDGSIFNEEYTLVACADYILTHKPGNTVSNMSSTRALRDITLKYGGKWFATAVGDVNVVDKMKEVKAVIGGEGNGGVIYPPLHYGRDALVGIALFLSHLARSGLKCSELRRRYPEYIISKNRIELPQEVDTESIMNKLDNKFRMEISDRSDGILIENDKGWVQVRKSNTEPILRIYSEAKNKETADELAAKIIKYVKNLI